MWVGGCTAAGGGRPARPSRSPRFPWDTAVTGRGTAGAVRQGTGWNPSPTGPGGQRTGCEARLLGTRPTPSVRNGEGEKSSDTPNPASDLRGSRAGRAEENRAAEDAGAGFAAAG